MYDCVYLCVRRFCWFVYFLLQITSYVFYPHLIDLVQKVQNNAATENYLNNLLLHGFLPLILYPTRISNKSATLIDHMYLYEGSYVKNDLIINSGNILSDISDHLPNFIILSNPKAKNYINSRPCMRLYTPKNKEKFSQTLESVDWSSILYSCKDVNLCFNKFILIINDSVNNCFPLTRQSRRAFKDKIWITTGVKNC